MHKSIQQRVTALILVITLSLTVTSHALAGQFEDGVTAYYQKNYPLAFELWIPLAEKGDAISQVLIGSLFAFGQGVKRDDLEAVRWYGQAAFQGNAQGQFNLAIMYEHGWGVAKNLDLAIYWYGKAAVQGRQDARERLATLKLALVDKSKQASAISDRPQADTAPVQTATSTATPPVQTPQPAGAMTKSTADTKLHLAGSPEHPAVVPKAAEATAANEPSYEVTPMNMTGEPLNAPPAPTEKLAKLQRPDPGEQDDSPPAMAEEQANAAPAPTEKLAKLQGPDPTRQDASPPESQGIFSFFGSMIGNILRAGSNGEEISFDGDNSFEEEQWKEDTDDRQVVASKPATLEQEPETKDEVLSKPLATPAADSAPAKDPYSDEFAWQQSPASVTRESEAEDEVVSKAPASLAEKPQKAPSSLSFLPTADGWKGAYADEYDWQTSPKDAVAPDVETEYEIPPAPADVDEPVKKELSPVAERQIDEDSDLVRLPNGRVMLTIPKKDE